MVEMKDMGELAAAFTQFELDYGMFDKKIEGVKFWQYIRDSVIESHLRAVYGIYNEDFLRKVVHKQDKVNYKVRDFIKENLIYNQFRMKKREVLIFASDRKVKDDKNRYRDVYTDIIDKNLKQSHYLLTFVRDNPLPHSSPNLIYIKLEQFKRIMGIKDDVVKVSKKEFEEKVIQPLESCFDIRFDNTHIAQMHTFLERCLTRRKPLAKYYNYILDKSRPKLILTVGIGFEMLVLCAVAKKKGIPVVVLQHGIISTGSFPYNSPQIVKISAFPDYMFVFGKYEKERGKFSIPRSRIIPVGYPELDNYIKTAKEEKTAIKKLLVLSCGDEKKLLDFTNELAGRIDGTKYKVVYKLHPMEYGDWKNLYGRHLLHPNIEVVGENSKSVYDYFMQADWVIGMFSTSLYEATAFNVKIAILDSAYKQDYKELFESKRAESINSVDEFLLMIDSKDVDSKACNLYFEENGMENVQKAVDGIIASGKNWKYKCTSVN